jgi:hypothetical protein
LFCVFHDHTSAIAQACIFESVIGSVIDKQSVLAMFHYPNRELLASATDFELVMLCSPLGLEDFRLCRPTSRYPVGYRLSGLIACAGVPMGAVCVPIGRALSAPLAEEP